MSTRWSVLAIALCAVLTFAASARAEDEPPQKGPDDWVRTLSTHSSPEAERVTARQALAALEAAEAQGILRLLLSGPSRFGRIEGAKIARLMGIRAVPLMSDLIENLRDWLSPVKAESAAAIGVVAHHVTDPLLLRRAAERLTAMLHDGSSHVRGAALESLVRMHRIHDEPVVAYVLDVGRSGWAWLENQDREADAMLVLRALLSSSSWHVRDRVLLSLQQYLQEGSKDGAALRVRPLIAERATQDTSAAVRRGAVRLLHRLGAQGVPVAEPLLHALSDRNPQVRAIGYRAVQGLGLASRPGVARLLRERLVAGDMAERAAAAWLLRDGPARSPEIAAALFLSLKDAESAVAAASAAALLQRGRRESTLLAHLLTFVDAAGVTTPYPQSEHSQWAGQVRGGRKKFDEVFPGYPSFSPSSVWSAGVIAALGEDVVPLLAIRLHKAKPAQRGTWIHALGHAGESGRQVLTAVDSTLSQAERFERDLIGIHAGASGAGLVQQMLAVVRDGVTQDAVDPVWWAHSGDLRLRALALDALVKLSPLSIDPLVSALASPLANDKEWSPAWREELERALRAIGQPALAAVERAAADKLTGSHFTALLKELKQ